MKKAVVIFKLDEAGGYCRVNVDKDDGLRNEDFLSVIGGFYADAAMKNDEEIACLSAMVEYIADKTGKGWRELLDEVKERMEEVDG